MDAKLSQAIANAHTAAEQAGLLHPNRQPVLDYQHNAVRHSDRPRQFQPDLHNTLDIFVTEDLGRSPALDPADLVAGLAAHFDLPHDPETYPATWRTPPQRPPLHRETRQPVPPRPRHRTDPNSPFGQLVECLARETREGRFANRAQGP